MTNRFFVIVAACLLSFGSALAQTASDTLTWNANGTLQIDSVVVASNGCYSAGRAYEGTPPGIYPIRYALSVTYPILHSGSPVCTMATKALKFSIAIKVPLGTRSLVIYEFDTHTRTFSARSVLIPPRPGL